MAKGLTREELRRERRLREAYRAVMATVEGRYILWELVLDAGVFELVLNTDYGFQSFMTARRNFGLELMKRLQLEPKFFETLQREWREREARDIHEFNTAQKARAATEGEP